MRKISKGLAVAAVALAVGGVGLAAFGQGPGPGYGPSGDGAQGYGPMMGYGPRGNGPSGPGPTGNGPQGYGPQGYGPGYGGMGYGHMGYGPGSGMGYGMGYRGMGYMHGGGGYGMMGYWGGGPADPAARLDAVKSGLALRPEQTAAWDDYAKAMTDGAAQMQALRDSVDFDKLRSMSWQDHWAYMGQFHDKQAAVFRSVQTAKDALLTKLDDSQKSRLLSSGPGYYGRGARGGYGGPGMMGPGYGMMGGWGGGYR